MNSKIVRDGTPLNRKTQEQKRNRNRCTTVKYPVEKVVVERFEENEYLHHPDEYERLGTDPSLLVIFNQKTFINNDVRRGSNKDVNELITTFGRLGHNIEQEFIYNDLSRDQILENINSLSQRDFSNRNSLIVVFLTHGCKNNEIEARDGKILIHDVWEPFYSTNCVSFKDKPKLFVFQACKGNSFSKVNEIDVDVFPESTFSTPLDADMLIAYAAVEGSVANRHIYNGTWFIQELCRNLNAYGRREDVHSLLTRTTKCIANNYFYLTDNNELVKQMPLFVSTLTKKFYLTKSKERHLVLETLQRQEQIIERLEQISNFSNK